MNIDPLNLIDGYFDDMLSAEQHLSLMEWIKSDPEHARKFAQVSLLHDRMQNAFLNRGQSYDSEKSLPMVREANKFFSSASILSAAASVTIVCLGLGLLWMNLGPSTATAAIRDLDRIIDNNIRTKDRTYEIVVEEVFMPEQQNLHRQPQVFRRPPKPPLDGAVLYVRDNNRFVLVRETDDGQPFITGSDGENSWAINSIGPVRVSSDIHHFDHDLPGHESAIPLTNILEGLERLRQFYDVQLSNLGPEEFESQNGAAVRMLVAIKKPKMRGPQRVEIAYEPSSGRILHIRFVQMPYGPERLDLRLILADESELPTDFFQHKSHHNNDRTIEQVR